MDPTVQQKGNIRTHLNVVFLLLLRRRLRGSTAPVDLFFGVINGLLVGTAGLNHYILRHGHLDVSNVNKKGKT